MNDWVRFMDVDGAKRLINKRERDTRVTGANVLVAVVDDGCDVGHASLSAHIHSNRAFEGVIRHHRSSHGTQSCGLVAGASGGDGKFPGGVANGYAQILAVRYNSGATPRQDAADYRTIRGLGPRVVSNSFGFPGRDRAGATTIRAAITELEAANIVVLFAAGNLRNEIDLDTLPATRDTILVGATGVRDDGSFIELRKLAVSQHGIGIAVCAPAGGAEGGKAVSTANTGQGDRTIHDSRNFGYHTDTSGACALVAGVVALMLRANPALTPRQVKTILCSTADKVDPNRPRDQEGGWKKAHSYDSAVLNALDASLRGYYYSTYYGFGQVNAKAAVKEAFHVAGVDFPYDTD